MKNEAIDIIRVDVLSITSVLIVVDIEIIVFVLS